MRAVPGERVALHAYSAPGATKPQVALHGRRTDRNLLCTDPNTRAGRRRVVCCVGGPAPRSLSRQHMHQRRADGKSRSTAAPAPRSGAIGSLDTARLVDVPVTIGRRRRLALGHARQLDHSARSRGPRGPIAEDDLRASARGIHPGAHSAGTVAGASRGVRGLDWLCQRINNAVPLLRPSQSTRCPERTIIGGLDRLA